MGFKSLVIRGLKKLWANLWTSQLSAITQNSCRPSKLTLTTNITGPGRGAALAASRHIIYGLELVKKFWKNRNGHPRHQDFIGLPGGRFLEGTRVAVPQFKQ